MRRFRIHIFKTETVPHKQVLCSCPMDYIKKYVKVEILDIQKLGIPKSIQKSKTENSGLKSYYFKQE